jgi:hypothetical protein
MDDIGSANPGGRMLVLRQVECRPVDMLTSPLSTGHDR